MTTQHHIHNKNWIQKAGVALWVGLRGMGTPTVQQAQPP